LPGGQLAVRDVVAERRPGWTLKMRFNSSSSGSPKIASSSARWFVKIESMLRSSSVASSRRFVGRRRAL